MPTKQIEMEGKTVEVEGCYVMPEGDPEYKCAEGDKCIFVRACDWSGKKLGERGGRITKMRGPWRIKPR